MPFTTLEGPTSRITARTLLVGAPNAQKSTSMLTWPAPRKIISMPGEKGHEVFRDAADTQTFIWQLDDPSQVAAAQVVREIEQLAYEIIAGKHGEVVTLGLDGLHKMFGWYYKKARLDVEGWSSARNMEEDKKNLIAYNPAYDAFQLFLTRVLHSKVPYIVASVWEGRTKDEPENMKSQSHIFPDLPGQMARWIVGEFTCTLYSEVTLPDPKGNIRGQWTTRPLGKIWGVGIKAKPEIAKKLPATLPNNFKALADAAGEIV